MMRSFRNYIWTMKLCLGRGGNEVSKEYTITDLYRQIGRTFRAHGVDKAVLLKARNSRKENSQDGGWDFAVIAGIQNRQIPT